MGAWFAVVGRMTRRGADGGLEDFAMTDRVRV